MDQLSPDTTFEMPTQDDLLKQRLLDSINNQTGTPRLGNAIEAANPQTTAMPNATANAQGMASPEQVNYVMNSLQQRFAQQPQAGAAPQMTPEQQVQKYSEDFAKNPEAALVSHGLDPMVAKELAKHITDSGPAKLIGKDIFGENRGGIFGSGISPIDVLAHAFGAAITSRLPQNEAIAATMKIGSLPAAYKAAQQKAGAEVIRDVLSAQSGVTSQGRLALANTQQQAAQQLLDMRKQFTDSVNALPDNAEMTMKQRVLGVSAHMLPESVLAKGTALVKTVMQDADTGEMKPVQIVVDKDTHQPILDANGKPTAFPMADTGNKSLSQKVRDQMAAAAETGQPMTIRQAIDAVNRQELALAGGKDQLAASYRPAKEGTYIQNGTVVGQPQSANDAKQFQQAGNTFYPKGSDQEKFYKAGNIVTSHIDESLGLMVPYFQQLAGGDHNKLVQYGKMKMAEFGNDPQVKAMIESLGPASSFAASAPYIAASSGMRGGPRIAQMFQSAFLSPTDTVNSFLKKQETFQRLNIKGLETEGVDTTAARAQLKQINELQAQFGGTATSSRTLPSNQPAGNQGGPPEGAKIYRLNPKTGRFE